MVSPGANPLFVMGATEAHSRAMRRPLLSALLAAGGAIVLCAVLLVGFRPEEGSKAVLLDREAAEIAKLEQEKSALEHSLKNRGASLPIPAKIPRLQQEKLSLENELTAQRALVPKTDLHHAAQQKTQDLKQRPRAAPPQKHEQRMPDASTAPQQLAAAPPVKELEAERETLKREIDAYKQQAAKQEDDVVGGILATYTSDADSGILSRTSTMHAAKTGLLGRVGNDGQDEDNVLGSLAATMSREQQEKMLEEEHIRQLDNVANAMGDVSPKEALAQRIIALGAQFLSEKGSPRSTVEGSKGPTSTSSGADAAILRAMREHARGRIARKHAHIAAKHVPHAEHAPHAEVRSDKSGAKTHAQAVTLAKKRVELLRRELKEAEVVSQLRSKLDKAQSELAGTHAAEAHLRLLNGGQKLTARLPGADEGANEKYENAMSAVQDFVGEHIAADEDDDAEDEPSMERRYNKQAHGAGYIKGAIYVGSREQGPDRYGLSGAGPQKIKNKLGDNFVDVGLLGSAGTLEGDVMVPTRLSGVRHRDRHQGHDPLKMRLGHVDEATSNQVVKGSLLDAFGGDKGMQMDDKAVPVTDVEGSLYKDSARTEDLAQAR